MFFITKGGLHYSLFNVIVIALIVCLGPAPQFVLSYLKGNFLLTVPLELCLTSYRARGRKLSDT